MSPPATAEEAPSAPAAPAARGLSALEVVITTALLGYGLHVAIDHAPYGTSPQEAATKAAVVVLISLFVCWLGLGMAGVAGGVAFAAALRAQLAWYVLLLGETPYIGAFFATFELILGAVLMRRRAKLDSLWHPVLIVVCARITLLLFQEALRMKC